MNVGRRNNVDRWYSEAAKALLTKVYYQKEVKISMPDGEEFDYLYLINPDDEALSFNEVAAVEED